MEDRQLKLGFRQCPITGILLSSRLAPWGVNFEIEMYPNNISITVAVASLAVAL